MNIITSWLLWFTRWLVSIQWAYWIVSMHAVLFLKYIHILVVLNGYMDPFINCQSSILVEFTSFALQSFIMSLKTKYRRCICKLQVKVKRQIHFALVYGFRVDQIFVVFFKLYLFGTSSLLRPLVFKSCRGYLKKQQPGLLHSYGW